MWLLDEYLCNSITEVLFMFHMLEAKPKNVKCAKRTVRIRPALNDNISFLLAIRHQEN